MSYTKGTWRYDPRFDAVVVSKDNKTKVVAEFGKCDLSECEANVKLIAASPELLEALQLIADGQVMTGTFTHADTVLRYQEIARKAIAKATGNQ